LIVLSFILITGCQKTAEAPPDTFTAAYSLSEEGRNISISGNSYGATGEESEYTLKINNNAQHWQDEYYILLVDSDSVVSEISHEKFDISPEGAMQKPVMVSFPEGFEGPLGLCVIIPQRASVIAALSVGVKNAIGTGWRYIRNYPFNQDYLLILQAD
jgi:hypothetical protein